MSRSTGKPPAFQLYVKDWLSSVKIAVMSPAEEGAYIRLLCHAWDNPNCALPNDDHILSKLSRLGEGWFKGGSGDRLRACFEVDEKNNIIYNKRLRAERKKQQEWKRKSQLGGVMSGKSRRLKPAGSLKGGSRMVRMVVEPPYQANGKQQRTLQSSSSIIKKKKTYAEDSDEFRLACLLFNLIKDRDPRHKAPNIQKWADEIGLMIRVDKRDPREIDQIIRACQAHQGEEFSWQNVILSPRNLRKHFDKLRKVL